MKPVQIKKDDMFVFAGADRVVLRPIPLDGVVSHLDPHPKAHHFSYALEYLTATLELFRGDILFVATQVEIPDYVLLVRRQGGLVMGCFAQIIRLTPYLGREEMPMRELLESHTTIIAPGWEHSAYYAEQKAKGAGLKKGLAYQAYTNAIAGDYVFSESKGTFEQPSTERQLKALAAVGWTYKRGKALYDRD